MPSFKSAAVILKVTDYAEFDRIVSFYTRDHGRLRGIAKGAKRSQKRFGGALEPFTHNEVDCFEREGHGLARLENCRIINTFPAISQDIKKIAYGHYLLELVNTLTPEREKHPEIFDLLLFFLNLLSSKPPREDILRIFEMRLTALLGYQPQLLQCVSCGRKYVPEVAYRFSVNKGGILCSVCHKESTAYPCLSHGTIKIFQQAQQLSLEKLNRIHFSAAAHGEGKLIMLQFLEYHIGKRPKSLEFIEQLTKV
jgi:DNA repair protein RecO (recombination protein O)